MVVWDSTKALNGTKSYSRTWLRTSDCDVRSVSWYHNYFQSFFSGAHRFRRHEENHTLIPDASPVLTLSPQVRCFDDDTFVVWDVDRVWSRVLWTPRQDRRLPPRSKVSRALTTDPQFDGVGQRFWLSPVVSGLESRFYRGHHGDVHP